MVTVTHKRMRPGAHDLRTWNSEGITSNVVWLFGRKWQRKNILRKYVVYNVRYKTIDHQPIKQLNRW